jgi:hypothetical protein
VLRRPMPGLWMGVGGKLTSARVEAVQAVDAIERSYGWGPITSMPAAASSA